MKDGMRIEIWVAQRSDPLGIVKMQNNNRWEISPRNYYYYRYQKIIDFMCQNVPFGSVIL